MYICIIDFDKLPTNEPKEWANFLHFGAAKREMLHNFSELQIKRIMLRAKGQRL